MVTRCKATNAAGAPCGAQALRDGWCAWHDPERAAEMADARRRGGQAKSNLARARKELKSSALSPAELEGIIGMTITQVLSGKKAPGVGQAIAALARASIAIRESTEFEDRLDEMARQIAELNDRRPA